MNAAAIIIRRYGAQYTGRLAQALQRATGVLLLIYLFLHVHTIHELSRGEKAFDAALSEFRHPLFKVLEIALLGTVILHALNGVRMTLIDLGYAEGKQKQLFWAYTVGLGAVIFLAGAIPLFLYSVFKVF